MKDGSKVSGNATTTRPHNVLIIMSDEHSGSTMGCAGHPIVRTPNLDRLAAQGTRFSNCYTPSPLCAPGRASAFTGLHVHRLGTWDNGTPFDGQFPAMWEVAGNSDIPMTIVGKTDLYPGQYRNLNVIHGQFRTRPDIGGLFRQSTIDTSWKIQRFHDMGPKKRGFSDDEQRTANAVAWLNAHAQDERPWVFQLGLLDPHFPWRYREDYHAYYDARMRDIPESAKAPYDELNRPLRWLQEYFQGRYPDAELIRKSHVAYCCMVNELDDNIGLILKTLEETGLDRNTIVIYCSDHGEQLGHHGLWWKCCMYEESVHVPMIVKGPGVPQGEVREDFISLLDLPQTVYQILGVAADEVLDGESFWPKTLGNAEGASRPYVFSEYHAHGMPTGMFMIRWDDWKLVHYVGDEDQLFNLKEDPQEMNNLLQSSGEEPTVQQAHRHGLEILGEICDPKEVTDRALAFQEKTRRELGLDDYTERAAAAIAPFRPEMPECTLPSGTPF